MLAETGKVMRFDGNSVWVQTIRHSVCGSCQARMGCGQNLLNQLVGATADIRVRLGPQTVGELKEGDLIEIGIEEGAVVVASLLAYGVPLVFLVLGILIADVLTASIFGLLLLSLSGLGTGILVSRMVLTSRFQVSFFEPVYLRKLQLNP